MTEMQKIQTANRQIRRVTYLGIIVNLLLAILKVAVGVLAGSMALIADGIHSVSDMATDAVVLLGVHFGTKEADSEHPYGHGRIETFSSGAIALFLVFLGFALIYRAGAGIAETQLAVPAASAVIAAVISIVVKELLYRITRKVAVKTQSSVLFANAWHHRSDALSSVIVVAGLVSLMFGFAYGDRIAAMAVGLMIALVGGHILADCFGELTESAVDEKTIEQVTGVISADNRVHQWHKLRTRRVGREVFLDLHILVDPALNITDAHTIAEDLESTLHKQMSRPVNITVHIEPDLPELRK